MRSAANRPVRKKTVEQVLAVLLARNLVEPVLPGLGYVPVSFSGGAALLALARRNGSSWEELGLARRDAGHGLRTGAPVALAVAGGMLIGTALPLTRALFNDERVAVDAGAPELVYQTIFRVPVGTVGFEELAFRGVLLDLLRKRLSPGAAVRVNSATFGLWHILPTLAMAKTNKITGLRLLGVVVGSVLATTMGGYVLAGLRLRGHHLLAPAIVHLAFNDVGYALAWWVRS